jgi:O-antigen ligase
MFSDHPVAGVGLGGFQPEILGEYSAFIPSDRLSSPVSLPHTELVRIAAETGIVGLIVGAAFFLALFASLARIARTMPELRTAATALGVAIFIIGVASQFEGRLYDEPYLWLFLGLTAALGALARPDPQAATG